MNIFYIYLVINYLCSHQHHLMCCLVKNTYNINNKLLLILLNHRNTNTLKSKIIITNDFIQKNPQNIHI